MISSPALLADLRRQLKVLVVDLTERAEETNDPDNAWGPRLQEQYAAAFERERTGHSWPVWRDNEVEQAAVAWLVATTFIRFCEDNHLLDGARLNGADVPALWIAGPKGRTARAVEHQSAYFRVNSTHNERDWLQQAFRVLAAQPAGRALLDGRNAVWSAPISAEAATALVRFWRTTDDNGALAHDFTDPDLGTRFLGDLYQDLSDHARDTYALLQTPVFVEEFILDRSLTPALVEFGLPGIKVIDPTCGSGHFLLGTFERLHAAWVEHEPGMPARERVRRAMDSVHGVDLNPFAVAIARFRLTVAGLLAAGDTSLVGASTMGFHLAVGDSLLGAYGRQETLDADDQAYQYDAEDLAEYEGILLSDQYHVVVGNPPYITVKDKALNAAYRRAYETCSGTYALSVPFMELFFRLAVVGSPGQGAGFVAQITSNSFMKREFGRKLIEKMLAGQDWSNPVDLTEVVDTSGAFIPGHTTPTVILVGRHRRPQSPTVRAVLGFRGEPGQPAVAADGLVWTEIVGHFDEPGFDGTYVSVSDLDRGFLAVHPWSLSGGGAAPLIEAMGGGRALEDLGPVVGRTTHTGLDEAFYRPTGFSIRRAIDERVPVVLGDGVRDFKVSTSAETLFPYDASGGALPVGAAFAREVWPLRVSLSARVDFGQTPSERGLRWFDHSMFFPKRYRRELGIAFAFVATHNHFVLSRGGKVFKQTAPVITLPGGATEQDHLDLLGVLNSSTACFWLHRMCQGKPLQGEEWQRRYEYDATKVRQFPMPASFPGRRGATLDALAREHQATSPRTILHEAAGGVQSRVSTARISWHATEAQLIAQQEELDWEVYRLYGILGDDLTSPIEPPGLALGERAFEIGLARRVAAGTEETAWFERHGSMPITEIPSHWPADYRELVQRRLDVIESNPQLALLEQAEHKRRWATPGWDALLADAVEEAILDRLEDPALWRDDQGPVARSVDQLASLLRHDEVLAELVELRTGSSEFDLTKALADVLKNEAVPYLAAHRYKDSGIEKYRTWQQTWHLQRREDAGETVTIAVPPKYGPTDFRKVPYWQARGKLDVPKERFTLYPELRRAGDSTSVLGWAGWDHAEQARALARELLARFGEDTADEALVPLVAGLVELEPWLDQWHGDLDPTLGLSVADSVHGIVDQVLTTLGKTRADVDAWRPAAATRGRKPRATA